jgi:hypothetical protein
MIYGRVLRWSFLLSIEIYKNICKPAVIYLWRLFLVLINEYGIHISKRDPAVIPFIHADSMTVRNNRGGDHFIEE